MAELKAAYLIHGDDHGAIGERHARLRALAEASGGAVSVELLDGEDATPAGLALALATMTFAMGQRVIIVDGVERWKQAEVERHLSPAMAQMPPETTVALFAREEGRAKAPAAVHQAVKAAAGQIAEEGKVKPWELPAWVVQQAGRMGIAIDQAAARALVAQVGERQQRLLRELEKLALEVEAPENGVRVSVEDVEQRAAHSNDWRAFALADALVGADTEAASHSYLRLRQQGERLSGLTYLMASRLREALSVSLRLAAGESVAEVKRGLRMPPRAATRFLADIGRSDPDKLRRALALLADLELDTRGGAALSGARSAWSSLEEDTLALRAIERIAA
jgi:DNA polymerase III subunit delta